MGAHSRGMRMGHRALGAGRPLAGTYSHTWVLVWRHRVVQKAWLGLQAQKSREELRGAQGLGTCCFEGVGWGWHPAGPSVGSGHPACACPVWAG